MLIYYMLISYILHLRCWYVQKTICWKLRVIGNNSKDILKKRHKLDRSHILFGAVNENLRHIHSCQNLFLSRMKNTQILSFCPATPVLISKVFLYGVFLWGECTWSKLPQIAREYLFVDHETNPSIKFKQ